MFTYAVSGGGDACTWGLDKKLREKRQSWMGHNLLPARIWGYRKILNQSGTQIPNREAFKHVTKPKARNPKTLESKQVHAKP